MAVSYGELFKRWQRQGILQPVEQSLKYNPDQPRDDHGRWTSEGEDTGRQSVPGSGNLFANDHDTCYDQCAHLLPSPSGDLQSSEFRLCYRQCRGRL